MTAASRMGAQTGLPLQFRSVPALRFGHLRRMTDHIGIWEHARYTTPRREHGYCTDDNARALIVVCSAPDPTALVDLARIYLSFLQEAALPGAGFHNRRGEDGAWTDQIGSDDSQGRAIWALGTVIGHGHESWMRRAARQLFDRQLGFDSQHLRSKAYAVLGAVEALEAEPDNSPAREALIRWSGGLTTSDAPDWPWPEPRLGYDNARIPEAMLAAGSTLEDERLTVSGLQLLDWLVSEETFEGHFSFTPSGGWARGEARPGYDQQPVEAGAMADACARAWAVTGDSRWKDEVLRAARWLVEANDGNVVLYDFHTGGCCDGLTPCGPNLNQGAESTLAALSILLDTRLVASGERDREIID